MKEPEDRISPLKLTHAAYTCPFPFTGPQRDEAGILYTTISKEDCFTFRQFVDSMDGYEEQVDANGIIVWERKVKGESLNQVKVFGTFTCQPHILYAVLQDPMYRVAWDESRDDGWPIARLDERQGIYYYGAKSPVTGVSAREFLSQRGWHETGSGEYVIFNTSVSHPSMPEKGSNGKIRAISKCTGYFVQPWGNGGCSLTYTTQVDPQGWIPTFVMNAITTKFAPKVIDNLRRASLGYEEWLANQTDHQKNWDLSDVTPWSSESVRLESKTQQYALNKWKAAN